MFNRHKTILAICLTAMASAPTFAETLQPPAQAEQPTLAPPTSSVGSTDILITVLATLLIWAAVQQTADANGN